MRLFDIISEAGDDSGDYQQMQAFVRANRVGGVPADQQVALALFKELKRQQQQNQALGRELSDAEKRIDQATKSGELSQQELGLHRGELDRERAAGERQKDTVAQLSQQYATQEKASKEELAQLNAQLDVIRNKPGINPKAVDDLEKQIEELGKNAVTADAVDDLRAGMQAVAANQQADSADIENLTQQLEQAAETAKLLRKTRTTLSKKGLGKIKDLGDITKEIETLKTEFNKLLSAYNQNDLELRTLRGRELPALQADNEFIKQDVTDLLQAISTKSRTPQTPATAPAQNTAGTGQPQLPLMPQTQTQAQLPLSTAASNPQKQLPLMPNPQAIASNLARSGDLETDKVYESDMTRLIKWATGRQQ